MRSKGVSCVNNCRYVFTSLHVSHAYSPWLIRIYVCYVFIRPLTSFFVFPCVKCMGLLILSSCVKGIVGGWGCWINHMWLWPPKPVPDMEQEGGRESALPLMNGRQCNTHKQAHILDYSCLLVFTHNGSAARVCFDISPCQRLPCLFACACRYMCSVSRSLLESHRFTDLLLKWIPFVDLIISSSFILSFFLFTVHFCSSPQR